MKHLFSILILLGFISTSNAGIFDLLKSDESFCIDTLVANDIREVTAANECTNPVPTQSCMKRVYKDLRERKSSSGYVEPIHRSFGAYQRGFRSQKAAIRLASANGEGSSHEQ